MATFFVSDAHTVGFRDGGIPATAQWRGGILNVDTVNTMAIMVNVTVWSNGLIRNAGGRMRIRDSTAGLPADVVWTNGLPINASTGALCYSTNPMAYYSNGIPFDAAGAVCGVVT